MGAGLFLGANEARADAVAHARASFGLRGGGFGGLDFGWAGSFGGAANEAVRGFFAGGLFLAF